MLRKRIILSIAALGIGLVVVIVRQMLLTRSDAIEVQHEATVAADVEDTQTTCHDVTPQSASRDAQIYSMVILATHWQPPDDVQYDPPRPASDTWQPYTGHRTLYMVSQMGNWAQGDGSFKRESNTQPILELTECEITALLAAQPWDVIWVKDFDAGWNALLDNLGRGNLSISFSGIEERDDGSLYLQVDYNCPMCGGGYWYVVEEIESVWRVKEIGRTWYN
jgi:hypothetical protein